MDREIRSVLTSVCIITALCIPVTAILVVTALICALKITFSAANKLRACVQSELELFNELCAQNQTPVWDELGLFVAFIKGEDVHGGREKKKNLRPKAENKKKAAAKTNDNGAIVLTSKVKRPMIGDSFLRSLLAQTPNDTSPVCTGFPAKYRPLSRDHKNQEYVKSDAVKSTSGVLVNSNINTRTEQHRAVNSSKDRKTENTTAALCTDQKLHHQDTIHFRAGTNGPCSYVPVPSENSATRKAKRSGSSDQANVASEVTPQEHQRSHSSVKKDKKRRKAVSDGCSNQVSVEKKVTPRQHQRSSLDAKQSKKRRKAVQASECSAKKRRKDPHRREISSHSSLRKMIAKRLSEKARAKARQRKLMELILTADKHVLRQAELTKAYQNTTNRNEIPPTWQSYAAILSEGTRHESGGLQNVFGELMNGKRPLPVRNPFKVEPVEEPMDICQELLPTAPSMTELVSLMEQLHIAEFNNSACDISDQSDSDDDWDGEYDLYPELQSLPEQVLNLIELLA